MEPITTAWMMSTLIGGWLGNRGDFWLCKGTNQLYKRIKENISEPANHHIQRAIRKSYLKATLMAIKHIQSQRNKFKLFDRRWRNVEELSKYIQNQIDSTESANSFIRKSELDHSHREILFPKNVPSSDRMKVIIYNLKQSIIQELEGNRRMIESALQECIMEGWKEERKEMDFYKLTCAFFKQELKENTELAAYIQTEYLDSIQSELGEVKFNIQTLSENLNVFLEEYKEVLPLLKEIYISIEEVKEVLSDLPQKTANIVLKGINEQAITSSQICVLEKYQKFINDINALTDEITSLNSQVESVKIAITKVDEHTQSILQINIENLENQILQKSTQQSLLQNSFEDFVKSVIQLAKLFTNTSPEEFHESPRLKKARELYEGGKYEELYDTLIETEIDEELKSAQEKKESLVAELLIKAQTAILIKHDGWFEEADRLYEKANSNVKSFKGFYQHANFLFSHNKLSKAKQLYTESLLYAEDDINKAILMNYLALIHRERNQISKAQKKYQKAVVLLEKLAKNKPNLHAPLLALTFYNLASLQWDTYKEDEAEKYAQKALQIYRKHERLGEKSFLPQIGKVLCFLGNNKINKKEFQNAEKYYKEANEIFRILSKESPKEYLTSYASSLNNFARIAKDRMNKRHSYRIQQKVIEMYRELSKTKSNVYLINLAEAMNNMGKMMIKSFSPYADYMFEESLNLYRTLNKLNSNIYLVNIAEILTHRSSYKTTVKHDYLGAKEFLFESLDIYEKLSYKDPKNFLFQRNQTKIKLHALNIKITLTKDEEEKYLKILRRLKDMPQNDPGVLDETIYTYHNLINNQKSLGKNEEQLLSRRKCIEIYNELAEKGQKKFILFKAQEMESLAEELKEQNKFQDAELLYKEALEIRRVLVKEDPINNLTDIADLLRGLGDTQCKLNKITQAEKNLTAGLDAINRLPEVYNSSKPFRLGESNTSLAVFYKYVKVDNEKSKQFALNAISNYTVDKDKYFILIPKWFHQANNILNSLQSN
jgi:hypothetical protein